MDRHLKIIKSIVGDEGFSKLEKNFFKRKARETVGVLDYFLPMLAVPRTIMKWLVVNITPMSIGDIKDLKVPGREEITLHIEKLDIDFYRADFLKDSEIIHSFAGQALPGVASHMMTTGELYDSWNEGGSKPIVQAIMDVNEIDRDHDEIPDDVDTKVPKDAAGKLVDAFGEMLSALMPEERGRKVNTAGAVEEENDKVSEIEEIKKEELGKAGLEGPSGAGLPQGPKEPQLPVPQGQRNELNATKQTITSGQGRDVPSDPKVKGMKKPGAVAKPPTLPGAGVQKAEGYFKAKLKKNELLLNKNEVTHTCPDCGKELFDTQKVEFKGCICTPSDTWFAKIEKSDSGKFKLVTNPEADQESVEAFVNMLKLTLLTKRETIRRGSK